MKSLSQMQAECLYTELLGSVVARGDECHTALLREMEILFGYLTGDVGIHSLRDRLLKITLRTTAAPGHALDLPAISGNDLSGTLQFQRDA